MDQRSLRLLLVCLLALSGAGAACRGGSRPEAASGSTAAQRETAPPTTSAPPAAGTGARSGLLIVRDRRLLLRPAAREAAEQVLRTAPNGSVYAYPRWSPDGRRIAYVIDTPPTGAAGEEWGANVAVSDADGTGERVVMQRQRPGTRIEGLDWSADGRALYLGVIEQEIVNGQAGDAHLTLQRRDLASGDRAVIAPGGAYPTVAPDGRIAFLTYGSARQPGGLWTANADGTNPRLILRAANDGDRFAGLRWPAFSPDGARIAFGAVAAAAASLPTPVCGGGRRWPWRPRTAAAHGPPFDIWTIAVDGGTPERLADLGEDDPFVAWSPDGGAVAVIATCGLYEIPLPSGPARKIGTGALQAQIDWR